MKTLSLARYILTTAIALTLTAGIAAAQSAEHSHHVSVCQLVPRMEHHGFVWTLASAPSGHGGKVSGSIDRPEASPGTTEPSFLIGSDPAIPPITLTVGHHNPQTWRLALHVTTEWTPALAPLPEPSEVRIQVTADVRRGHVPLDQDVKEFVVAAGVADVSGGTNTRDIRATFTFELPFVHGPGSDTMDDVQTMISVRLLASDGVSLPGHLTYTFDLNGSQSTLPPGAFLEIPGDCTTSTAAPPTHYATATPQPRRHATQGDGGDAAPTCAADCSGGTPPTLGASAASVPTVPGSTWAPAAVTAGIGIAGLAAFRPRRP